MIDNVLIISDYDDGYTFSTYYRGMRNNMIINDVCGRCWGNRPHKESFKLIKATLSTLCIHPDHIIICSDGAIYLEDEYVNA